MVNSEEQDASGFGPFTWTLVVVALLGSTTSGAFEFVGISEFSASFSIRGIAEILWLM